MEHSKLGIQQTLQDWTIVTLSYRLGPGVQIAQNLLTHLIEIGYHCLYICDERCWIVLSTLNRFYILKSLEFDH